MVDGASANNAAIICAAPQPTVVEQLSRITGQPWALRLSNSSLGPARMLQSAEYNVTSNTRSTLRAFVSPIPGHPSVSAVVLYRQDRWRDWGREFHFGIPLPFKAWGEASVVEERELAAVVDGLREQGTEVAFALEERWTDNLPRAERLNALLAELNSRLAR